MSQPKLWTKDFLIVSIENFFVYFTYYILIATITVYATEKFHASPSTAGLAAGIFIFGALFGRLFAGRSIDQFGRKKMLYFGFIFFLVTTLLYFFVTSLPLLIILRIFHGAAFGVSSTATGTIVAEIIPNERRGEGTGYYALSTTLAAAIGPFLGMFLIVHANFSINLIVCTVVIIISFIGALLLKIPKLEMAAKESGETNRLRLSSFFEAKAIPISIVSAVIGFSYSSILSFLTSYSKEIGLVDVGSFFFVIYAVAILISRPFTGRLFDQVGENIVVYCSFILFAIGLIILGNAHHGFALLAAGAFVGLGYGNYISSAQAISVKVSPRNRMGLATSTFFMFTDGGAGIGPFLIGFFIPYTGFRGLYTTMAIVTIVCIILYHFLHGRKAKRVLGTSLLRYKR